VQSVENQPTFWRNHSGPFSGSKDKPSKYKDGASSKQKTLLAERCSACFLVHHSSFLSVFHTNFFLVTERRLVDTNEIQGSIKLGKFSSSCRASRLKKDSSPWS
jgi:hypothetical protein